VRGVCVLLAQRGCVLLARRGSVISAVLRGRAGFAVSPRRLFVAGLAGARFRPCGILARGFRVSSARSQSFQLEVSEFRPNGVWSNEVLRLKLRCLSLDFVPFGIEASKPEVPMNSSDYRAGFADSPGSFYARSVHEYIRYLRRAGAPLDDIDSSRSWGARASSRRARGQALAGGSASRARKSEAERCRWCGRRAGGGRRRAGSRRSSRRATMTTWRW
jgi:hypothetical protein